MIDTSAFAQAQVNSVANEVLRQIVASQPIATCLPITLELLYSSQNTRDFERRRTDCKQFEWLEITPEVSDRAIDIQWQLAKRGQHRRPSPDLTIAATAAVHNVPILHYDHDFDLIADVTGQATEWIVPRGTGH